MRRLGCASRLVDISPIVDGYFGRDGGPGRAVRRRGGASPLRRGNFMARARMMVLYDASVTWGGLVVGTGNKTETLIGYTTLFGDSACAFNPIGDLYKTPGPPAVAGARRPRRDHPQGAVGRPVAGPDRRGGGRLQLPRARPPAVLDDRPAAHGRRAGGAGLRPARRSPASTAWSPTSEFKRQVPPIAKLGPRTAGVDYLYPRRRPGSARGRDRRARPCGTAGAVGPPGARAGAARPAATARSHAASSSPRRSATSAT